MNWGASRLNSPASAASVISTDCGKVSISGFGCIMSKSCLDKSDATDKTQPVSISLFAASPVSAALVIISLPVFPLPTRMPLPLSAPTDAPVIAECESKSASCREDRVSDRLSHSPLASCRRSLRGVVGYATLLLLLLQRVTTSADAAFGSVADVNGRAAGMKVDMAPNVIDAAAGAWRGDATSVAAVAVAAAASSDSNGAAATNGASVTVGKVACAGSSAVKFGNTVAVGIAVVVGGTEGLAGKVVTAMVALLVMSSSATP